MHADGLQGYICKVSGNNPGSSRQRSFPPLCGARPQLHLELKAEGKRWRRYGRGVKEHTLCR